MGIVSVGFDKMGQYILDLLLKKRGVVWGETMKQCIEFKEAYDSVMWEVVYNIIEFGVPMKW